ncbi:MAG: hypothetical protein U1A78_16315 [Polyangia bacterium]
MLYEMLCGAPPFMADSLTRLLALHVTAPVPPLRARAPEPPPALEQVVLRMLAKSADVLGCAQLGCALSTRSNLYMIYFM